jgi:hypothetical protein
MVHEGFVISPPSIGGTVTSFSELPTIFDLKEKTPFGKASFCRVTPHVRAHPDSRYFTNLLTRCDPEPGSVVALARVDNMSHTRRTFVGVTSCRGYHWVGAEANDGKCVVITNPSGVCLTHPTHTLSISLII